MERVVVEREEEEEDWVEGATGEVGKEGAMGA